MRLLFLFWGLVFIMACEPKVAENKDAIDSIGHIDTLDYMKSKSIIKDTLFSNNNQSEVINEGLIKIEFTDRNYYEKSIFFYKDSSLISLKELEIQNLDPLFYYPDNEILYFSCVKKSKKYYKVVVNEQTKECMYIKIDKTIKFENWNQFLLNSFGVSRKGRDIESMQTNKFHEKPFDDSKVINMVSSSVNELLCVQDVQDNWIKVKKDCFYDTPDYIKYEGLPCKEYIDSCFDSQLLWLKWRNRDSILIDIYLAP